MFAFMNPVDGGREGESVEREAEARRESAGDGGAGRFEESEWRIWGIDVRLVFIESTEDGREPAAFDASASL
jgi:hypothetical protein